MFRVDATNSDRMGKRVNDDHLHPNCLVKVVVQDIPRLYIYAGRDISAGEELRYCYGRGKYPWRAKKKVLIH